jgi:rRNA maturation RNase YbeY
MLRVVALEKKFIPQTHDITEALLRLFPKLHDDTWSAEVYLVGSRRMHKNVLSYPATKGFPHPDIPGKYLGEIYLNPDYIEAHGESLAHMLIHGFLHLLGYVHDSKDARMRMERRERVLLRKLGE